ncbi:MAG: hypothetical protein KGV51_01710 [Moraxellaceae bacterium]|nr:hypothetical protein [Moraxellaceae bacterium]
MSKSINKTTLATLKLFKAVLIDDKDNLQKNTEINLEKYQQILAKTLPFGYLLDPCIPLNNIDDKFLATINEVLGLSAEQANQTFHKSWQTIADSSYEQLAIQQIAHYITTYGFERLGVYQQESVYIPNEVLEIPELELDKLNLQVVRTITANTLIEKVFSLASGIALAEDTLEDLMTIISNLLTINKLDKTTFIDKIGNRELQTQLAEKFNLLPNEPVAFLRHIIYQLTGDSLLIKNRKLIEKIKTVTDKKAIDKLDKSLKHAPNNLASIFLRYKPLFLALKSVSNNKALFNRLRKQAKKQHKPLPVDYLNNVTCAIKNNELDLAKLENKLKSATIYRKIRLANALNYRLNVATAEQSQSIVYRVRNGRGWATQFIWDSKHFAQTQQAYNLVVASIADDMRANVTDKTFYIPSNVNYTLPATEKQFTGNFPTGSYVAVADNLIVGIHWENIKLGKIDDKYDDFYEENFNLGQERYTVRNMRINAKPQTFRQRRIDLDLSTMDLYGNKVGWNSDYYSDNQEIIFSGDITDAPPPQGATELFYIKKGIKNSQALMVNYFNYNPDFPVDCKLLVAHEKTENFHQNYMVNPNNIVMQTTFNIGEKQNMLGLIHTVNNETRVYFANMNVGTSIASYGNDYSKHAQQYLLNINENGLMLKDILRLAGASVLEELPNETEEETSHSLKLLDNIKAFFDKKDDKKTDKEKDSKAETEETTEEQQPIIDLSPMNVDKTSFIELLQV